MTFHNFTAFFFFWNTQHTPATSCCFGLGSRWGRKDKKQSNAPLLSFKFLIYQSFCLWWVLELGIFFKHSTFPTDRKLETEKKKGVDLSLSLKWISLWMAELLITLCHHIWLLKKFQFPDTNYPSAKPLPFTWDHLRLNYLLKENMSVSPSLKHSTCLSRALFHHPAVLPSPIVLHCLCTDLVRQF